ncbi:MAG TPA: formylglycine-generating enzyme family protein [Pseudomonadales bacterium]|nr:formylglycine-generating enzyme family protein [Pseudomonadales bacterium]
MTLNPAIETQVKDSTWRDVDFAPWMVTLPSGEFMMGENAADKFANDTERPAHRIKFTECFALGKYPVTAGEFRRFRPGHLPGDNEHLPVINVNWHDATAYCEWLAGRTDRRYRLPSETEWEFACRAGSRTPFSTGNGITTASANFLYDENGLRAGIGHRAPVGSYSANAFGLHDFHGNVCEWVADAWHPDYTGAPANGNAWMEGDNNNHVIRGGAWDYLPSLLRSSWRDWREANFRADNLGFRVALSMGENK